MEWLKQQGPWCPGLIEYLERHHQQYDVLVFFTYLYAPTVLGIRIAPSKSLLVPTAHDEPAIRLGIYRDVFSSAAAIVWNTEVERNFVTSMFHLRAVVEDVVGCGVDMPEGAATADDDEPPPDTGMGREAAGAAHRRPGQRFPPPPSHPRPIRALRRPDRSGQGLRRAARVLPGLRQGRRRRVAAADGRQADAAAGRPARAVRRHAARRGTAARARSRDGGRRARRRTRACRSSRSRRSPSARRCSPTRAPRSSSSTAARATPASTTRIAGSSSKRSSC